MEADLLENDISICDYGFIGRIKDLKELDEQWKKCKIFGIHGIRAVGKSSFIRQFLKQKNIDPCYLDLATIHDVKSLAAVACASLGVKPEQGGINPASWIHQIMEELNKNKQKSVIFFFDNAEDAVEGVFKDTVLSLFSNISWHCPNVKVIITSTTRLMFSQLGKVYYQHELTPLLASESLQLLHTVAAGVELDRYGETIADLSEGLPLLILLIGSELKEGLISPEEMVDRLLVSRLQTLCSPPEETSGGVYNKFIRRLSEVYLNYMTTLDYIPGSFSARQAGEILEIPAVACTKQFALKPFRIRSMLTYDPSCQRFNIQGILREILRAYFTIKDLPAVRSRYCKIFTAVMKDISAKMGTADYLKALSLFTYEQPNLRKLLGEVNNTNEENYHFFIEMASSCTELIEIYLTHESEQFYEGCLRLANEYGQETDRANVLIAVGSLESQTKGDLISGAKKYEEALKVLEKQGRSLQLAKLYQKLGWNVYKQGECPEAIKYYNKSLDITQTVVSGEFEAVTLQSLSYLGGVHVVLGSFDVGERYHTSCLQRGERLQGKVHPQVGDALSRIGLLYEQKGDMQKALKFFQQGLEVKKQSNAAPISIVYSISLAANGHRALGNYAQAHALVEEAFRILNENKIPMLDGLSLIYNTLGKIYAKEGKLKEASDAYSKTVEITRQPEEDGDDPVKWIQQVTKELARNKNRAVLFFDNAEDAVEGDFKDTILSLFASIAGRCSTVKVMITSTTRLLFSQLGKVYYMHELQPLDESQSLQLLHSVTPNVDLSYYGSAIAKLSEGLPLLILMIGFEMEAGLISAESMIDLLLVSRLQTLGSNILPAEDCPGSVYKQFIQRLSAVYLDFMTTLDFIPGSFNAQHAGELLGISTVACTKQFALRPIRVRSMLTYDPSCGRFNIQGVLREILRADFSIKDLPAVRSRYCKIFTAVMKDISAKMGTAEYLKALSNFTYEQPNLRKLLLEVTNTNEENYHLFIEMACSCTDVIEIYLASESERFYEGCLRLAIEYGQDVDKASVFMAVGSMETHTKGDLISGAKKYRSALDVLENQGRSLQLAKLYQKLGWNVFKQGDCPESIKYYNKSLDITQTTASGEFESVTIQSLSYLGATYVVLGNFDVGERYHTSCLQRSERLQGKVHPKVGDALNRIGLLHEQRGDIHTALEFFQQGLDIKKQSKAAPISVVYSLSNVANGYKALGMYGKAHALVDEAFEILHKQKIPMLDGLSLMYNTRGKIYAMEGMWNEASEAFGKTVEITRKIEQTSYIYMKRLLNLAEMEEKGRHIKVALTLAQEALQLKEVVIQTLPHNFIVTECLQCMTRIYKSKGDLDNYKQTLYMIDGECTRLGQVVSESGNHQDLHRLGAIMNELKGHFQNL